MKTQSKTKKIKNPFTPEQEALMELANKYNAVHKDLLNLQAAIKSIPISQNIMMSMARAMIIAPDLFARYILDLKTNKAYELEVAKNIKELGGSVEEMNKKVVKKDE